LSDHGIFYFWFNRLDIQPKNDRSVLQSYRGGIAGFRHPQNTELVSRYVQRRHPHME
jgi:hypothetical protein